MAVLSSIRDQHPFVYAREKFLAGELLVDQAILMAKSDSEFEYQAVMHGGYKDIRQAAEVIVRTIWAKELVELLVQRKRGEREAVEQKLEELRSEPFSSSDQLYRMRQLNRS